MLGAITQDPIAIGRELVAAALKAKEGQKLPKVINTGYYWYDKRTIDDPKIQSVLYR